MIFSSFYLCIYLQEIHIINFLNILFPFFQFLPYAVNYFILTKTKLSRGRKRTPERAATYIKEIRLLTTSEMLKLFPGCKVYFEKVAGLVKSITVHNLPD